VKKTVLWIVLGVGLAAALIAFAVMGIQKGVRSVSEEVAKGASEPADQAEAVPPEGVPPELVALAEKRLAFLKSINGMMATGLADCPKMATKIDAFSKEHRDEMQSMEDEERELKRGLDADQRSAYESWALARMKGPVMRMVKLAALMMVKCPDQMETVQAATSDFDK